MKSLVLVMLCFGLTFLSGCGGPGKEATIEGTVTLDNVAVGPGLIAFHPQGGGAMAYAQFDSSGKFSVKSGATKGLDVGEYVVTVAAYGEDAEAEEAEEVKRGSKPEAKLTATPVIYAAPESTPLKLDVKPGRNTFPVELKSTIE